jgi:PAS domain S-box-containing protein
MPAPNPALCADTLLREHAARLLDSAGAIVLVLDPEARIVSFNPALAKLSRYAIAEGEGHDWFERFVPSTDRERLRDLFHRTLAGEAVIGNVNSIQTRAGELREIEWHANAVQDLEGATIGVINIGLDITDKLEMQDKLVQSERLAAIGMLAAMFAHEVGNPLNAMYLQAQLLRRKVDSPHPGQPLGPRVDALMSEIQRLNSLLEDFRAFQRPERILLEPTDVSSVLSHVAEAIALKAEAERVALETALDVRLPRVNGNANKLKQVFINLCKNAIEAMPDGGTLTLVSRQADAGVLVEVRDTGRGIPEGLDVFEPFASSKPAGMGLGLALVREIVTLHGGTIRYASSPAGTTFTVELPGA